MINKNAVIQKAYKTKLTRLGTLYMVVKVDKEIPVPYVDDVMINRLIILNEAIINMNLDGIINFHMERVPDVDDDIFDYYVVEISPRNRTYVLVACVVISIMVYYLMKYSFLHRDNIINIINSAITNIIRFVH